MVRLIPLRGYFSVNAYFYIDDMTGHGFLIDPGDQPEKVMTVIRRNGWTIDKILLTHGHFDHMGAAEELALKLGVHIFAYDRKGVMLRDAKNNLSALCGPAITIDQITPISDGDFITLDGNASFGLKVIHAPGHTPDSVVFYSAMDHVAFVGDTIFKGSVGNWTYPLGDRDVLLASITEKIFRLPDDTVILSGHSDPTTVGEEKRRYGF